LFSRAATLASIGMSVPGMSMMVVTPPTAAEAVAVSKLSSLG